MGRLRTPWTSQPPLGTPIDPAWAARGLQLVFDGQRVVYSRESSALQPRSLGGTPKFRQSARGAVVGIGATYGSGTTDRIDSGILDAPKSGMRSVVAHLFVNSTGGGGFGRVFQNASGSGLANAGDEAVYTNTSGMLFTRQTSTVTGASYTTTPAFPTGRWASYGVSFLGDYPTNTAPLLFIDGVSVGVTTTAEAGSAFTPGTSMNVSWGNRVSDSARSFDGMIGPVLIFDGYLSQAEHKSLSLNPWQVFKPLARNVYFGVPAAGGSTTITCSVASASSIGVSAQIPITLQSAIGAASAVGVAASVNTTIQTSVASAAAASVSSLLSVSVIAGPGVASATGVTASIAVSGNTTITCSVAASAAVGVSALVNKTLQASVGSAVATGVTANVFVGGSIVCTVGSAGASGVTSQLHRIFGTTVGNAIAAGTQAAVGVAGLDVLDADRFDYRRALRIPNAYAPDPAIARMGQRMTRRNRW